jgi:hypothetical protein
MLLLAAMAQTNLALTPTAPPPEAPEPAGDAASREIVQLLQQAAELAVEAGVDSNLFMQAAWAACLDARPGLREEIADKELRSQLKKLRKRGMVGQA